MSEMKKRQSGRVPKKSGGALFGVLKGMTIAAVPLMLVPFMMISVTVCGQLHFGWTDFWKGLACLAVCSLFGALLGLAAVRYAQRRGQDGARYSAEISLALKILSYAVSPAVSLSLSLAFWPPEQQALPGGLFPWLTNFAVLEACWILSVKRVPGSYTTSFEAGDFTKCAGIYLVPVALLALFRDSIFSSYEMMPLVLSFCAFTAITGIVLNQQNIDLMMERRRHDKGSLPGKIRVYNLLLVTAALAVVFIGLIFGNQIGGALVWALKKIGLLVVYFIMFLMWLSRLGQGDETQSGGDGGGNAALSGLGENTDGSPLWNLLLVLLLGLLVYIVIVNRKRIWAAVRGFFSRIGAAIYHFFLDCFQVQDLGSAEGYYTEAVEALSREERPWEVGTFRSRRELRRALRQWQKVSDPVQRVRGGYRLLMMASKTGERPILPSDTTGQILEKNRESALGGSFIQANPVYERVRYGGAAPESAELELFERQVEKAVSSVELRKKR